MIYLDRDKGQLFVRSRPKEGFIDQLDQLLVPLDAQRRLPLPAEMGRVYNIPAIPGQQLNTRNSSSSLTLNQHHHHHHLHHYHHPIISLIQTYTHTHTYTYRIILMSPSPLLYSSYS